MSTAITTLTTQGPWQPVWLCRRDLESATSATMVAAIFDDDQTGSTDDFAMLGVIERAETQVLSWLSEYGPPPFPPNVLAQLQADRFLKGCALAYVVPYMFDRHPEYVRANRQEDVEKRLKRADDLMMRVLEARQRPPTVPTPPANVGGASVDNGPRAYVDSADGTRNSGDY